MPTVGETSISLYSQYLDSLYSHHSTSTVLNVSIPPSPYFASNGNQYCTSSKSVEHQLSMSFLSRLIASIWLLYTAITKPVLLRRLAYLLFRYFGSNSNQYCNRSKSVEHQLSLRFLCRLIAGIWILFTASTKSVLYIKGLEFLKTLKNFLNKGTEHKKITCKV